MPSPKRASKSLKRRAGKGKVFKEKQVTNRSLTAKGQIRQVMSKKATKTSSGLTRSDIKTRRKHGSKRFVSRRKSDLSMERYHEKNGPARRWNQILAKAWKETNGTSYPGPGIATKGKEKNPVYRLAKERFSAWKREKGMVSSRT